MASRAGQDVHPFFKPRQIDLGEESDAEEPRRKRRRTHSADSQLAILSNWQDQLKAAADGGSLPTVPAERHSGTEDAADRPNQQHTNAILAQAESPDKLPLPTSEASGLLEGAGSKSSLTKTPPKRMLRVRSDGKLASPKAQVEKSVVSTGELPISLAPRQYTEDMPPKKILKVRADGKLISPKAKAPTSSTRGNGRKRISKIEANIKSTCIAVMKYGFEEGTRANTGRQVDEILSRMDTTLDTKPSRPSEPPKSTHPFFTGELGRKANQRPEPVGTNPTRTTDSHNIQAQQAKNILGPRESRITSKPPGTVNMTSVAHGATLPTFGTDHAKVTRFPGARDPIWPPFEMLHVGRSSGNLVDGDKLSVDTRIPIGGRKLKDIQVQIFSEENVLNDITGLVHLYNCNDEELRRMTSRDARQFRRPHRKVMTGKELQQAICSKVACNLPKMMPNGSEEEELNSFQLSNAPVHKSLLHVYNLIANSRAAFDQFQCETQEWVHKYSPKSAEHVLQQGHEAIILRDWLKGFFVSSVGSGIDKSRIRDSSAMGGRGGARTGRKKKRRTEELDGFVISSDEEANEMDEITRPDDHGLPSSHEKKSVMRIGLARDGERTANAVVISGPHGCGKTAAVLAVALELGFEVFEVNAGSRRSGKDILDKVGDMTHNHLVKHGQEGEVNHAIDLTWEMQQANDKLRADLDSGRQGKMQSFFKAKQASKTKLSQSKVIATGTQSKKKSLKKKVSQEVLSKPRDQKQSLVLLEEVDVLFEEDKLFWATVLDLILGSKRPVIMTCSDESLLPLDDMALYAILRFTPPPETLATDYLLLVAASEGHLLSRESVQLLYNGKGSDLRASLAELNLYCQMGVGDSKGGLEWMLIDKPTLTLQPGNGEPLRVISENTYCSGMGWLSGEDTSSQAYRTLGEVTELCAEVWSGWGLDIGATDPFAPSENSQTDIPSREEAWNSLKQFDQSCEAFSAADILPASVLRHETSTVLDTAQPDLTDRFRCNFIEGPELLQADPLIDYTGKSECLGLALRASATLTNKETECCLLSVRKIIDVIPQMLHHQRSLPPTTLWQLSSAFKPIAGHSPAFLGAPKGPSISSFDSPLSVIAQDVAPYIRGIVSYDLRLEEQRRQLSSLLTQPGAENKKTRTTRASRAALEGGSKANTRRERWFPKSTDFSSVLETGGKDWQKTALQTILGHSEDQSVEGCDTGGSSLASDAGAEI